MVLPPPVTPSPHRFILKKQAPMRKPPLPKQESTPRSSAPQFNATPRFAFSSTPRASSTQALPTSTPYTLYTPRFVTSARQNGQQRDVIEESSDDLSPNVHHSIEIDEQDVEQGYVSRDAEDEYKIDGPTPKRRRLSTSPVLGEEDVREVVSSPLPILSSPPAPRRPLATTAPRFLPSTPAPPSTPQVFASQGQSIFVKPPRFRPPDPSQQPQAHSEPLPEQFSPHRRGQKYLPGGLAAEVRDWLLNIESAIPANSGPRTKDDPWIVKIVIDEVSGSEKAGMMLVKGRQIHREGNKAGEVVDNLGAVKIILAGEGAGNGMQKGRKVEIGKVVSIKGPIWEIPLEGERWGVGTDWKVLV